MSHVHAFSCIHFFFSMYFDIFELLGTFLIVSSLSLLLSIYVSLLLWHSNVNLFRPGTLFVLRHLLLLILPLSLSDSVMRRLNRTSLRTFLDEPFILNTKSSCRTSPTLTFPLSFTVRNGSHCVTSRSHVHPC